MIMVRGYAGRALLFQEKVDTEALGQDAMRKLAEEQLERVTPFPLHMIEIEFLDEPDVNKRFFRFGSDTSRMVNPAESASGLKIWADLNLGKREHET